MKEKFKSILLFTLVGISIFMAQKIWIQIPHERLKTFGESRETYNSSYLLSDMIIPSKYLLSFGKGNHTLAYDDIKYNMWSKARKSLTEVLNSKDTIFEEVNQADYESYGEEKSVTFHFSEEINTNILAKAWDIKNPNIISDAIPSINRIYIYLGNRDPFFVFSKDDTHIGIYDQNVDTRELKAQLNKIHEEKSYDNYYSMKENYQTKNNIYIPVNVKGNLPRIYVSNIMPTLEYEEKVKLAEGFFNKRIDYIREIVESNGSIIYVYDQSVLKLNVKGTLEYFNPLESIVKDRNLYLSLSSAAEFITEKSGAQEGMYISKIEKIESDNSLGYKFTFKYRIKGIPVILDNKETEEYIQMEVFNNHIRTYKHLLRNQVNLTIESIPESKLMLSSFDVIDMNYNLLRRVYLHENNRTLDNRDGNLINNVLSSIEDINLAYYDPNSKEKEEKLIEVWAIKICGRLLAFDAYNGKIVYEK